MKIRHVCVAAALATVLPACNLTTDADVGGTFTASVTGDLSASLEGTALYVTTFDGQFSLAMTDPNGTQAIAVGRLDLNGRPGPGTYDIVPADEEGPGFIAIYERDGAPQAVFWSDVGTLHVTASSRTRIEGSLNFEGVGFLKADSATELRVSVSGSFDARCVRTGGTDCN